MDPVEDMDHQGEVGVLEMAMEEAKEVGIEWAAQVTVEMPEVEEVEIGDSGQMIITETVDGVTIMVHGIIRIQVGALEVAVDIIRIGRMIVLGVETAINKVIQAGMAADDQCVERASVVEIVALRLTTATKVSDN